VDIVKTKVKGFDTILHIKGNCLDMVLVEHIDGKLKFRNYYKGIKSNTWFLKTEYCKDWHQTDYLVKKGFSSFIINYIDKAEHYKKIFIPKSENNL